MKETNDIKIDLKDTEAILCDKCKNDTFEIVYYMRKVSSVITGETNPSLIPIAVYGCSECGYINEMFKPAELKENDKRS